MHYFSGTNHEDYPDAVITLGAGHTSYKNELHLLQVKAALINAPCVLLILPSEDKFKALREPRERSVTSKATDWISFGHDCLAEWLNDEGTRELATETTFTANEAPEVTAKRIIVNLRGTKI